MAEEKTEDPSSSNNSVVSPEQPKKKSGKKKTKGDNNKGKKTTKKKKTKIKDKTTNGEDRKASGPEVDLELGAGGDPIGARISKVQYDKKTTAPLSVVESNIEPVEADESESSESFHVVDISTYPGNTIEEKVDNFIKSHSVVMISKSLCAFCRDVKDLLTNQIGVKLHLIEVNLHPDGDKVFEYVRKKYNHKTVPIVFVREEYIGGCDTLKALHNKKELESKILAGLIQKERTQGTDQLETSRLAPVERSRACHPLFWFPNVVNNYIIRVVGFQVCLLSVLSAAFLDDLWGRYLAAGILIDFVLRFVAGSGSSPLGMVAQVVTSFFRPQFRPGPPKQFAAACGIMFSGLGTLFYFLDFEGHQYVGAAFMAGLAGASGLEWSLDFCLGCKFYAIGIYLGMIPDYVYRIYTSSRQETEDSWNYMFLNSNAEKPETIETGPSPVALKYKRKSDEWTKEDFHLIRNMQVSYFAAPLALSALAVAFKMGSEYFKVAGIRETVIPETWFHVIATIAAAVFGVFLVLYLARAILYPHKIRTEWDCPLRSPSFGAISIAFMIFAFLLYDIGDEPDSPSFHFSRVIFWIGAVAHSLLTVAKIGEWIGRRLEIEHVHAQWMILPVGLSVAGLITPILPLFPFDSDNYEGTIYLARFFNSFAQVMAITLFVITFFKVVTTHNSDSRIRHGVFIWLATPCALGLSNFAICAFGGSVDRYRTAEQCKQEFSDYYFVGIFTFFVIFYSSLPHLGFLGNDNFGMSHWIGCFSLSVLAACGCVFYALTNFNAARTLQFIFLSLATIANFVCLLHTASGIIRRRGVFTPEGKWGPLSFMKLTHEAFRGNMDTMRSSLGNLDLSDDCKETEDNVNLFAAHLNRFSILHDEHSKHEDEIIFKTFNDWFHDHAKKYNDDHEDYHRTFAKVVPNANILLNRSLSLAGRQEGLNVLKEILPPFFDDFENHLRGEEDNLVCIGRKFLPLELQKQISRKVWEVTPADRWEVIIPFVINNLSRHPQRVRYLKVLLWSLPERAHQIGMIIYRNVDAVMWERLRVEVPEMIPRGAANYRRYY